MSKGPKISKSTAEGGEKNELYVPSSMNPPQWRVKIRGEDGNLVENYHDLSADSKVNQAVITLSFDSGKKHESDDLDKVVYRVVNPKSSSREEWKQMQKEALTDFLINKSSKNFLDESQPYKGDLKCTLKKEKNQIKLLVEKLDGTSKKIIESENLEWEDEFYWKGVVRAEDNISFPTKKPWLKTTAGKISIVVALGVILLIIIFRKKIWGWMKRDKKKREEIIL